MKKPSLILYLDLVSPFAYLAFHVVRTSPVFKDVEVTYVPVFLGDKGVWVGKERLRWAKLFNVPMVETMPPGFPQNTIHVQRALVAVSLIRPQQIEDIIAALYDASFVKGQEIHTLESVRHVFVDILGEADAEETKQKAKNDEIKKLLTANTDQAMAEGSFGLPWFVGQYTYLLSRSLVNSIKATNAQGQKEGYWGFDHIAQVADHLGLERPKPGSPNEGGWRAML
ncbi:MAG: hypothetical protein Q9164_005107 [Protoblastenia rupestris]